MTDTSVPAAFDRAAFAYDRLVNANPGYHPALRAAAREFQQPRRLLDVGCGTGASTAALLAAAPEAEIVAVDASAGMLAEAARKPWPATVSFVHASAEGLAEAGVAGPFDGIFAAYLLRNVDDPDARLRDLYDRLRPGGTLVVHEYSVRDSVRARLVWHAICWTVIIPAGKVIGGDASLYRYLWRSVLRFDGVDRFRTRLANAGFTAVTHRTAGGWQRGVLHTFTATRPEETR